MPFHFHARYVLLTYAQCGDLDPWEVADMLHMFPAECIIGRENHDDGGIHLHAFVDFGKRVNIRDERRLDVAGHHPNFQPCGRTPEKMYDYAIKDGDVVAGGLERPDGSRLSATGDVWTRITNAESVDEFWSLVGDLAPRQLVCNFNSLRSYAEWRYQPERLRYEHPAGLTFDLSGVEKLNEWVCESLSGTRGKLLARSAPRGPRPGLTPSRYARPPLVVLPSQERKEIGLTGYS